MEGQAYILFDGDTPWSHIWDAIALASVLIGLLISVISAIRKQRDLVQAQKELA
jgi:hypothetical protein